MGYYVINQSNMFWDEKKQNWSNGPLLWHNYLPIKTIVNIAFPENHHRGFLQKYWNWRFISPDCLGRVLAEHAITKKSMIEIIDKHNYDIWE